MMSSEEPFASTVYPRAAKPNKERPLLSLRRLCFQHATLQELAMEAPTLTSALMLLARFAQSGRLSLEDRGTLKDLALASDQRMFAALHAFHQTGDEADLLDTWRRLLVSNRLYPSLAIHSSPATDPRIDAIALRTVARMRWFPLYRFVQQQQLAADPQAALARIERYVRVELGRVVFDSESLSLGYSVGSESEDEALSEEMTSLEKDLDNLSIQELCAKYGGQGAYFFVLCAVY